VNGVTVIVYDQQCAAEARRLRKRGLQPEPPQRVVINEGVCEGCGDCSTKSNCLSVLPLATEMGEKRQIHDPSCNRDYTCLDGDCPSFVTLTPARRGTRPGPAGAGVPPPALPRGPLPLPVLPVVDRQHGIYFTGIGGTGVVTATRIVASAAEAAGFLIGGMDQTGLSQKAGAVVSHLHLARDREALGSATVGDAGADLYLSGDILQAAGAPHLAKVRPGRTIAAVDIAITPTAAMLQSDLMPPDSAGLQASIAEVVGADRCAFVDSKRIAEAVFGDHLLANVVLLGAAFQMGGLPMSLDEIDRGMTSTGNAAADNRAAFEWGRWAMHDPAAVAAKVDAAERHAGAAVFDPSADGLAAADALLARRALPAELRDLLRRRTAQVVDYQDRRRARRFLALVEQAAAHDDASHGFALTRAVTESWFRLLTYKDEYEVARLHLNVDYDAVARELGIDGPYEVRYHLHPPVLRRLGLKRKLPMGRTYEAAFHVLRRMKRLRGTPLDPFGLDPDRRLERAVIEEYEQLVLRDLRREPARPYDRLLRLAASAQEIKGYAGIKQAAVARWRAEVAELEQDASPAAIARS
jgi:indolepyruvate ferredoxin oxidoreductase